MPRTLRIYTIASLVIVLAAGLALVVLYRSMVAHDIEADTENNTIALVERALDSIGPEVADYLTAAAQGAGRNAKSIAVPPALDRALDEVMHGSGVIGIVLFDKHGMVGASKGSGLAGSGESGNAGFISAIDGQVVTRSVENRSRSGFGPAAAGRKVVETYVPLPSRGAPAQGVLGVHTDVTPLVVKAERTEARFLAFALLIIVCLYVALLLIVRWTLGIAEARQDAVGDESALVTLLSQRSLRREELVRKKLSVDLREDLAQTLSAIKLTLENAYGAASRGESDMLKSVVPDLQHAIGQVRAIATELRPPGLDDLGLVAAITALGREFGASHPGIRVALQFKGKQASIPLSLQIVIYRNIEVALGAIGKFRTVIDVWIAVRVRFRTVTLTIKEEGTTEALTAGVTDLTESTASPLSPFRERTVISGGRHSIARSEGGALILRASWNLQTGARQS